MSERNASRTLFGTDGIRGKANAYPVCPDVMIRAAQAAALFFGAEKKPLRALIAKDTRLSGYMIESALTSGFVSAGVDVIQAHVLPTPGAALLARALRADCAVMISASHNPFQDNGIKIFNGQGHKLSDDDEREIERLMLSGDDLIRAAPERIGKAVSQDDAIGRYSEYVKQVFPRSVNLSGMKVVIDCAHGAGFNVAPRLLWELGAETVAIGCAPDGININKDCGSTSPQAMVDAVKTHGADIGIALDGDGDRLILCDENGDLVCGDRIVTALALHMHKTGALSGGGAVMTAISNMAAEDTLAEAGIRFFRTDVGDRYVTEKMRESGCNLGGEKSGHVILGDYGTTGDGLMTALYILGMMRLEDKKASAVLHPFTPYPQAETNIPCDNKAAFTKEACAELSAAVNGAMTCRGMALIRPSGTENLVRVTVQGSDKDAIAALSRDAVERVKRFIDGNI